MPQIDSHETLHESPLMSALTKLPTHFDSIDEAAAYMKESHVGLEAVPPFSLGGCTFSYAIGTPRSAVYFGYDESDSNKLVVGKIPRTDTIPQDLSDDDRKNILKQNAHGGEQEEIALKTLQHNPYAGNFIKAITITDSEFEIDRNFIITEFISPGISLHDFVTLHEGSTIEDKADFAAASGVQIGACILELHQDMMIHRDIKPNNVMLRHPDEEMGFIVMTDFNSVTQQGYMGSEQDVTPGTTAPELILKDKESVALRSNLCDIYSIGATMYFMVLGEYPCAGSNAEEVIENMSLNRDSPRQKLEAANVPAPLVKIILKSLHINPKLRYKHVQLLINDLKEFLKNSSYAPFCGDVMMPEDSIDSIQFQIRTTTTGSRDTLTLSGSDASTPANGCRVTGAVRITDADFLTAELEPINRDKN